MTVDQITTMIENYRRWRNAAREEHDQLEVQLEYWEAERARVINEQRDLAHAHAVKTQRKEWHETLKSKGIDVDSAERLCQALQDEDRKNRKHNE